MKFSPTPLSNAWLIETAVFEDCRGKFVRLFCQKGLKEIHEGKLVEQINYSVTLKKGTIRGLHFQCPPECEVKLVRCLRGSVFDVMLDLRRNSPTLLHWYGEVLSGKNAKMVYVPEGVAHGFQTLEDDCEMLYLHSRVYSPSNEGGIRYDDPRIRIEWPCGVTEISERDRNHPFLTDDFRGIIV